MARYEVSIYLVYFGENRPCYNETRLYPNSFLYIPDWNENVVILTKVSLLTALKVVILATFSALRSQNFVIMKDISVSVENCASQMVCNLSRGRLDIWSWMKIFFFLMKIASEIFTKQSHAVLRTIASLFSLSMYMHTWVNVVESTRFVLDQEVNKRNSMYTPK